MANPPSNGCGHGSEHRHEAPVYYECPHCLFLTPDKGFPGDGQPCPSCGSTEGPRRIVPAERLRRFDQRIRDYHEEGEHEIVVILVATLLETVFEDILSRMMQARGADLEVIKLVLDTERSVGLRLGRLFPTMAGETFENVSAQMGYNEFPRRWRAMRAERNAFIHGESFDDPREMLDAKSACEAMALLDQAYDLFVSINNRFVAGVPVTKTRRRPRR